MIWNNLWLWCLRAWVYTKGYPFVWLANRIAPRVTYFPDCWYTQRLSHLTRFGLTQTQVQAIWEINGTWDKLIEWIVPISEDCPDCIKGSRRGREWLKDSFMPVKPDDENDSQCQ